MLITGISPFQEMVSRKLDIGILEDTVGERRRASERERERERERGRRDRQTEEERKVNYDIDVMIN